MPTKSDPTIGVSHLVLRGTRDHDRQMLLDVYVLLIDESDSAVLCYEPYRVVYGIPDGMPPNFTHRAIWLDSDYEDAVPLALAQGGWPCLGEVLSWLQMAAPSALEWIDPLTDADEALTRARIAMDLLPANVTTTHDDSGNAIMIAGDYGNYSVALCDIPALADAVDRLMSMVMATQPGFEFIVARILAAYRIPVTQDDDVDPAADDDLQGRRRDSRGAGEE